MRIHLFENFEKAMIAVTFSERGQQEYAMKFLIAEREKNRGPSPLKGLTLKLEDEARMQ